MNVAPFNQEGFFAELQQGASGPPSLVVNDRSRTPTALEFKSILLSGNTDSPATAFDPDEGFLTLGSAVITRSVCGDWSPGRSSSPDDTPPADKPDFAEPGVLDRGVVVPPVLEVL